MKTNYTAVTALICFSTLFSSHGFAEQDRNALENTFAKSQAGVVKSIAIQTVYSRQSSYNERITHNTSSQVNTYQDQSTEHNGFKWDNTHYTNDQASTSSTPSYTNPPRHSGYRWGTRSLSDQAGFRWGTHSFSDQAGFRWGTHSFSDQAGFRWDIKGAITAQS